MALHTGTNQANPLMKQGRHRATTARKCASVAAGVGLAVGVLFTASTASAVENLGSTVYVQQPGQQDPRTLLNGSFGSDPAYDEYNTVEVAQAKAAIQQAMLTRPGQPVYIVGEGESASVTDQAVKELRAEGVDTSKVFVSVINNPRRAIGGLETRFGGPATLPNEAVTEQIAIQYGLSDTPKYPLNFVATTNYVIANTILYDKYNNYVGIEFENTIISISKDGELVDVLFTRETAISALLRQIGVPNEVVNVFEPTLKAIVETGYAPRPEGIGAYPDQPERFQLFPSPTEAQWAAETVKAGVTESVRVLTGQPPVETEPELTPEPDEQSFVASVEPVVEKAPKPEPTIDVKVEVKDDLETIKPETKSEQNVVRVASSTPEATESDDKPDAGGSDTTPEVTTVDATETDADTAQSPAASEPSQSEDSEAA